MAQAGQLEDRPLVNLGRGGVHLLGQPASGKGKVQASQGVQPASDFTRRL